MSDAVRDLVRTLVGQLRDRLQQQEDEILRLREALEATPASDGGEVRGDAPAGATLYRRRCGWCGAYEGTVDPKEPCAKDEIGYIGPHQFEVLEAVVSGSGTPPGEGERANCRCAPAAPWRSDGATCPDWPGCGNPDWRPATPQEASGV